MSWNLERAEKVIGLPFKNRGLLRLALTHRSYPRNTGDTEQHNERLEFLGDAILGSVVTDYLYRHFPHLREDKLTALRSELVCERQLAEFARQAVLGPFILLGTNEKQRDVDQCNRILADTFEAVVGAIYLDGGFAQAQTWIVDHFLDQEEILCRAIQLLLKTGTPPKWIIQKVMGYSGQRYSQGVDRLNALLKSGSRRG